MPSISLTRLRLRGWRFVPLFVPHALRSNGQARRAPGFLGGAILADRGRAFWTLTAWADEAAMRAYMLAGAHRAAMPTLAAWCDEAAVARWESETAALPTWAEADRRLRQSGRASRVRYPSPAHAGLTHAPPRTGGSLRLPPQPPRGST